MNRSCGSYPLSLMQRPSHDETGRRERLFRIAYSRRKADRRNRLRHPCAPGNDRQFSQPGLAEDAPAQRTRLAHWAPVLHTKRTLSVERPSGLRLSRDARKGAASPSPPEKCVRPECPSLSPADLAKADSYDALGPFRNAYSFKGSPDTVRKSSVKEIL